MGACVPRPSSAFSLSLPSFSVESRRAPDGRADHSKFDRARRCSIHLLNLTILLARTDSRTRLQSRFELLTGWYG